MRSNTSQEKKKRKKKSLATTFIESEFQKVKNLGPVNVPSTRFQKCGTLGENFAAKGVEELSRDSSILCLAVVEGSLDRELQVKIFNCLKEKKINKFSLHFSWVVTIDYILEYSFLTFFFSTQTGPKQMRKNAGRSAENFSY